MTYRQRLPLDVKILMTKRRIEKWYEMHDGQVFVSRSGKDSAVLYHIASQMYPDIKQVTCNTGLENPHNIKHLRKIPNLIWVKPKVSFREILIKYGYPIISKMNSRKIYTLQHPTEKNKDTVKLYKTGIRSDGVYKQSSKLPDSYMYILDSGIRASYHCCLNIKEAPLIKFAKETGLKAMTGMTAAEGGPRKTKYLKEGCTPFGEEAQAMPLGFWTEQDILEYCYIYKNHEFYPLELSEAYGKVLFDSDSGKYYTTGESRTGCMFCMFGIYFDESPNRFQRMAVDHPGMYRYCIEGGEWLEDENGVYWGPNSKGLGMWKVLEILGIDYKPIPFEKRTFETFEQTSFFKEV